MNRKEAIAFGNRVISLGLNDDTQQFAELAVKLLEEEPCEDCVSRAELKKWLDMNFSFGGATKKLELFDRLDKELPPVQPKAKVGKWIRESRGVSHCSRCAQQIFSCQEWFKRCPNCEAKMESEK